MREYPMEPLRAEYDALAGDPENAEAAGEGPELDELPGLDGLNPEGLSSAEADAELSVGDEKVTEEGLSKSWGWSGTTGVV